VSDTNGKFSKTAKAIAIGVPLLILILAMPSCRRFGYYQLGDYAVHDSTLFLVEYRHTEEKQGLPIPDVPPWRLVSIGYQLAAFDLDGVRETKKLGKRIVLKAGEFGGGHSQPTFIALAEDGRPSLMSVDDLLQRLHHTVTLDCHGQDKEPQVNVDRQDFRVVYYYCGGQAQLYRFEAPFEHGTKVVLAPGGSMPDGFHSGDQFLSEVGDTKFFVKSGWRELHEVDIAGAQPSIALNRYAGPDDPLPLTQPLPPLPDGNPNREEAIIGITSKIRIHEVSRANSRLEVAVVEPGKDVKRLVFEHPVVNERFETRAYIASNRYVVWEFSGKLNWRYLITLNLGTGKFTQLGFPVAK
jgi:hypothetical protein